MDVESVHQLVASVQVLNKRTHERMNDLIRQNEVLTTRLNELQTSSKIVQDETRCVINMLLKRLKSETDRVEVAETPAKPSEAEPPKYEVLPATETMECVSCNTFRSVKTSCDYSRDAFTCDDLHDPDRQCGMSEYRVGCRVIYNDRTYVVSEITVEAASTKLTLQRSKFGKPSFKNVDEASVCLYQP